LDDDDDDTKIGFGGVSLCFGLFVLEPNRDNLYDEEDVDEGEEGRLTAGVLLLRLGRITAVVRKNMN
jgi:hypothetical protein